MLGRLRRTTRLDVGLALAFTGIAYLVWALTAGASRGLVQEMIKATYHQDEKIHGWAKAVKVLFVDAGFVIDLVGLAWMAVSLLLVGLSSRQKISVSWSWVSAVCQSSVAAIGAVMVAWAVSAPFFKMPHLREGTTPWEQVSGLSLPVILVVAVLSWTTFLIWLLVERARYNRRGPTLRDGLKSNIYR